LGADYINIETNTSKKGFDNFSYQPQKVNTTKNSEINHNLVSFGSSKNNTAYLGGFNNDDQQGGRSYQQSIGNSVRSSDDHLLREVTRNKPDQDREQHRRLEEGDERGVGDGLDLLDSESVYTLNLFNESQSLEIVNMKLPIKFENYKIFLSEFLSNESRNRSLFEEIKPQILSIFHQRYSDFQSSSEGVESKNPVVLLKFLIEIWKKLDISYEKRFRILQSIFNTNFSNSSRFLDKETDLLMNYYHLTVGTINLIRKKEKLKYERNKLAEAAAESKISRKSQPTKEKGRGVEIPINSKEVQGKLTLISF
jgi:hypothetical protein